jgi:ABC-type oligopeptide transport system substrate-binding subunit/DNA-binding SARP family transcriptional activator
MPVSLILNTLGRLEMRWAGEDVPQLKLRKSKALLIYLALNPGRHDRSRLAGLLWGDLPKKNARRNLRHALHTLRRSLDPALLDSDRVSAGLNPDVSIQVDALDFEAAIARAERCQREEDLAAAGHLETGIKLYQGDFLAGFVIKGGAGFEDWAASRRIRMRRQFLEALDAVVAHWTRRGKYERALRYARRQLALEPLWEKSHRQMMLLLALTGQRSIALAQYNICRQILAEELGLEPLEETTALYRTIQGTTFADSVSATSDRAEDQSTRLLFVGREEEHATLVDWWETSRRTTSPLTLVEGEAGVGKTRLVEEVVRYIEPQGALILRGHCYEFGGSLPYQPFAEALRDYLTEEAETAASRGDNLPLRSLAPAWLAELARLLPELGRVYPDTLEPAQSSGEAARQRLFEAIARLLRAIGEVHSSVCLFLDDLHWADRATLDLLHYLVRHLPDAPIWFVGTYRPEEVALSHPLTRLRQGLGRDRRAERLALEPLPDESVRTLAHALVGERDSAALGDFLCRESEGNPFILVEMVSALNEQDALAMGDGAGAPAAEMLPPSVQDIILQRVGRLSEPAQRALILAAVVGQPFGAALLDAAAIPGADTVEACLDEWLARRLIQRVAPRLRASTAVPQYDFSHDKIRAVLYHATDARQRRSLHRRVGEALERVFSAQLDEHVGPLAYHWEQAQDLERATAYLLRAGDQARRLYAHQEAADYYERALALLERQGDAGREQAAQTLMKLGLTHHDTFDFQQARQVYQEGLERWQQEDRSASSAPLPPAPHALRVRWLEPTTLDPTMSPDSHTSSLMMHLFSGLVALSPELTIVPDVARAWDVSADGRRYIFQLRDDVRWSDGAPVTAQDFAYAWKRALDPAIGSPSAGSLHNIAGGRAFHQGSGSREDVGVRATDALTLLVELEEPTSYFLQLLVRPDHYPVPRHVVEAHDAAWTEPGRVVTNGPFRLEAWQRGEKLILSRNPDYHGRFQGNVQQVELSPLTDWAARLERYEADALDVLGIGFFPPEERQRARQRHADDYISRPILETCYLAFDVTRPPFDDTRVRRAFTLATDREALAEGVLQGYAAPAAGGLLPQGMPGHSPDVGLPYDPDQARRLLAEAGYPDGRGFPVVDALAFAAVKARTDDLQAQWRQTLGVEIAWQTPDWATFLKQLRNEQHHVFCAMWVADYPDPDNFLRVSRAETWAKWHDKRYERLVEEAGRAMNQEERMRLYRQADRILVAEAPILPLTYEREHLLIKPWVMRYPTAASKAVFWKDVVIEPRR